MAYEIIVGVAWAALHRSSAIRPNNVHMLFTFIELHISCMRPHQIEVERTLVVKLISVIDCKWWFSFFFSFLLLPSRLRLAVLFVFFFFLVIDVRGCCIKHGMTHSTCLDRMCDPKKADFNEIADLMVCAPWANISFRCLVNSINHTPCCIARGIPNDCLAFCAGNVTDVTFNSFKWVFFISHSSFFVIFHGFFCRCRFSLHDSVAINDKQLVYE